MPNLIRPRILFFLNALRQSGVKPPHSKVHTKTPLRNSHASFVLMELAGANSLRRPPVAGGRLSSYAPFTLWLAALSRNSRDGTHDLGREAQPRPFAPPRVRVTEYRCMQITAQRILPYACPYGPCRTQQRELLQLFRNEHGSALIRRACDKQQENWRRIKAVKVAGHRCKC